MSYFFKRLGLFVLVAAIIGGISAYGVYRLFYPGERLPATPVETAKTTDAEEKFTAAGRTNIALLGIDAQPANKKTGEPADKGRADTVAVVMYDPQTEKISFLSVPRDLRVQIVNKRWDKIGHSYRYGGAENTVAALENLLGIKIDHYVELDFKGFERVVDAVGGITVNVEKRMYYHDPWEGDHGYIIDLRPGEQLLDGKRALQFVRFRDSHGDVGRLKRQQIFLNAAYDKMSDPSMWIRFPKLIDIVLESVTTDMNTFKMLQLARTLHRSSKSGIQNIALHGEPVHINQISYLLPDIVEIRSQVADVMGISKTDSGFAESTRRLAELYAQNLPSNIVYYGDSQPTGTAKNTAADKKTTEEKGVVDKKALAAADKQPAISKDAPPTKPVESPPPAAPKQPTVRTPPTPPKPSAPPPSSGPNVQANDKTKADRLVRVAVVNCSGNPIGGKKMENLLVNNGIRVASISSGAVRNDSSIVSNTYDGWVVSKLAALPFRYALRLNNVNNPSVDATVYVGKDFL